MEVMKEIMTFDNVENREEALNSLFLLNHFTDVKRWSTAKTNGKTKLWLEVLGVPVHAWCEENATKIRNVWGNVLEIDRNELQHYNLLEILVEAAVSPTIQERLSVMVQGEEIEILVKEIGRCIEHPCQCIKKAVEIKQVDIGDDNSTKLMVVGTVENTVVE
ncbi:hypothetical protein PIB30_002689 [Stylosanthes scabra]|uniref:DUF4283 domain-containing protein n=1 Tax=Stylosanthes scabra TaxID=79078 RepID=A0ABU6R3H0_9FABA|nr:hypothetical protein [Stylosanthes scabra]